MEVVEGGADVVLSSTSSQQSRCSRCDIGTQLPHSMAVLAHDARLVFGTFCSNNCVILVTHFRVAVTGSRYHSSLCH
jgi:hypothetical protein